MAVEIEKKKCFNEDVVSQLVSLGYGTRQECIQASYEVVDYNDINSVIDALTLKFDKEMTSNKNKIQIHSTHQIQTDDINESHNNNNNNNHDDIINIGSLDDADNAEINNNNNNNKKKEEEIKSNNS
eukprot:48112_1